MRRRDAIDMTIYKSPTPEEIERRLESVGGLNLGDNVVPSQIGLPAPTGLTGDNLKQVLEEIFDDDALLSGDGTPLVDGP